MPASNVDKVMKERTPTAKLLRALLIGVSVLGGVVSFLYLKGEGKADRHSVTVQVLNDTLRHAERECSERLQAKDAYWTAKIERRDSADRAEWLTRIDKLQSDLDQATRNARAVVDLQQKRKTSTR